MPYAYYARLKRRDQATYRKSDAIVSIELPQPAPLVPLTQAVETALESADRAGVRRASQALCDALLDSLGAPRVRVKVLARRPSTSSSELHGLYEPGENGAAAVVTVWMQTSSKRRTVAFRTFLRTLLHELCHHLDYELLELEDSFHTEGFFKRESSLFKQVVAQPPAGKGGSLVKSAFK
jgi:hypothetical protein